MPQARGTPAAPERPDGGGGDVAVQQAQHGGARHRASAARSDQASMRRSNMGLILRHLRDHAGQSRARVAAETGLSKATTSSLIGDLVERGLVTEGELHRAGSVGRPGLALHLDGRHLCGVGLEINVDYLSVNALDLTGTVLHQATRPIDAASRSVDEVLAEVADFLKSTMRSVRGRGVRTVAIAIAAPGSIDIETGEVQFAPNVGWRDVALVKGLARRLGRTPPPIFLENDAKLGAVAEFAAVSRSGVRDLLYITGDVGVGGGIITDGRLLRGFSGFAGEIGHLPLDREGRRCACGRQGCWETMVGLNTFLALVADPGDEVRDTERPLEGRLAEIGSRADAGDERVLAAIGTIADGLGVGVSLLVDILNPQLVILGGYFAYLADRLVGPVTAHLAERRMSPEAECAVSGSTLGLTSAARGGAHLALDTVFRDPVNVGQARANVHSA
jgi:predicted NBD/HSP70 family sugar kinase/predicted transcriptional regulator